MHGADRGALVSECLRRKRSLILRATQRGCSCFKARDLEVMTQHPHRPPPTTGTLTNTIGLIGALINTIRARLVLQRSDYFFLRW